jgi:lipoyl(octanoyl) transferase
LLTEEPAVRHWDAGLIRVEDLGRLGYVAALRRQREVLQGVLEGTGPATLLLVEHDPVITVSQRRSAPGHLLASAEELAELGIDVQPTDRGGDVTYHGPGQLVAYPILRLEPLGLNIGRYMRLLEQVVIDTVSAFGVRGLRREGFAGVWAGSREGGPAAKLCAMGVRVRRNVTMHGLALNVCPNLKHFGTIVPCGMADCRATSLRELLGDDTPSMQAVKDRLVKVTKAHLTRLAERGRVAGV